MSLTHLQVLALRSLIQKEKAKIEQEVDALKKNWDKPIKFANPDYLTNYMFNWSFLEGKLSAYLYTYAVVIGLGGEIDEIH